MQAIAADGESIVYLKATGSGVTDDPYVITHNLEGLDVTQASLDSIDSKLPALVAGKLPVDLGDLTVTLDYGESIPVTLPSLPAGSNTIGAISNTSFSVLQSGAWDVSVNNPISVSGTVNANTGLTQPLTDAQLRAANVGVTVSNPTDVSGLATSAKQDSLLTKIPDGLTVSNNKLLVDTALTFPTEIAVNNFPATQAVSIASLPSLSSGSNAIGSITNTSFAATQSGSWTVGLSGSLPAFANTPTVNLGTIGDAATSAKQDTANTSLSSIDGKLPSNLTVSSTRLLVDGSGVTQPISGSVTANTGLSQPLTKGELQSIVKYDTSWITAKTFSNTLPDSNNSAPAADDFVSVNLTDGVRALEVYVKDLIITNAPSSVVVAVWVKVGTATPYLLGTFGATVGENRATVISGSGFSALTPILMELMQKATDIKVACKIIVDATRITYTIDSNVKSATQTTALGANTGFNNTLCFTNSNSAGSPPGIAGTISFYDPTTYAVTIQNASFITGEQLRLPWGATPANYFPPLGLSGKIICAEINRENNTINIVGSGIDFRLICYRQVRLRLSSISSAISVFPSGDGTVLNATTTYTLLNVSGSVGNQTAQISTNGITPLTLTSQGVGWIYVFPYRDIDNVSLNASNQLVIDGNIIDVQNDWSAQPVAVTTAGIAANIAHTGHGFSANDAVRLGGGTAPGGSNLGDIFYVISVDANNYKLSAVSGGLPVAFTSAGINVTIQKVGSATINAVTVTAGTPSVISFGASSTTLTPHSMGALQRFTLGGSTRPGAAYTYTNLFVSGTSLTATTFQCNQRFGMPSVAFETVGSNATLTAILRFGNMLIERATLLIGDSGDTDSTMTIKDSSGSVLSVTGLSTTVATIQTVNTPVIASGTVQVRPIGGV